MGIKGLLDVLRDHECVSQPVPRGVRVAVDGTGLLFRTLAGCETADEDLVTAAFVGRITGACVTFGWRAVVVFDGAAPAAKGVERARRTAAQRKQRESAAALAAEGATSGIGRAAPPPGFVLDDPFAEKCEAYRRAERASRRITAPLMGTVRAALDARGIEHVRAEGEADRLCVQLCYPDLEDPCSAVVTDDTDIIAMGAPCTVMNLDHSTRPLLCVAHADVCAKMDTTPSKFLELCLVLGTDYSARVRGCGPKRAVGIWRGMGGAEAVAVRQLGVVEAATEAAGVEVAARNEARRLLSTRFNS